MPVTGAGIVVCTPYKGAVGNLHSFCLAEWRGGKVIMSRVDGLTLLVVGNVVQ